MTLIKKIDVPRYFAARRAERRLAAGFGTPSRSAADLKAEPARKKANEASFGEDFIQDHSSPRAPVPGKN